jgi:recombinational DNA repair protein RecR
MRVEKQLTTARSALEQCRGCPKMGHPEQCLQCAVGAQAKDNALVGMLIRGEPNGGA